MKNPSRENASQTRAYDRLFDRADDLVIFKGKTWGQLGLFVRIGDKEALERVDPLESFDAAAARLAKKVGL